MQKRQLEPFGQKKTHQSHPPVCMPYKNNTGKQMSPKREKNPVPCWILNVPETVSNQWQGCSQGADGKYLHLIILAWKWMAGKRKRIQNGLKIKEVGQVKKRQIGFWENHSHSFYHFIIAFGLDSGFLGRTPTSEENKQMLVPTKQFFTHLPPNPKVMGRKEEDYIPCIPLKPF